MSRISVSMRYGRFRRAETALFQPACCRHQRSEPASLAHNIFFCHQGRQCTINFRGARAAFAAKVRRRQRQRTKTD